MKRLVNTHKLQPWDGQRKPWVEMLIAVELGERVAGYWFAVDSTYHYIGYTTDIEEATR